MMPSRPPRWSIVAGLILAGGAAVRGQEPAPTPAADAYRARVLSAAGDAGRGRRLFEDARRGRCALCHAVDGRGGNLGPDLAGVGGRYERREDLLRAVVEPSAAIHPDYAATTIAARDGRVFSGIVRPVSDSEVEIATSESARVRLPLAEIEDQQPSPVSLMPEGFADAIEPAAMADLLAYLAGLVPPEALGPAEAVDADAITRAARPVAFRPIHDPANRFDRPVWFGPVPGQPGTFAVLEHQKGRVWLLDDRPGGAVKAGGPFVDVGAETTPGEITGLLGLAFHPDFARNRRYFLKLHGLRDAGRLAIRIVERRATDDGRRDAGVPSRLVMSIPVVSEIHNGGHLAFGPDGFLYVGMGDTGPQGDPRGHGQDLGTWLGKILRIDVDRSGDAALPYAIPPDNPFRDRPGARPEVWAYGFREPWRFSFDPATRDLWVGDVGQNRYEEVGIVRAGENHGWNVIEGLRPHSEQYRTPGAAYVSPIFSYGHRVGVSVTAGAVYRGKALPALAGRFVFADFETRRVWALAQKDRRVTSVVELGRAPDRVASFGVDEAGELYLVGYDGGTIYRVDPAEADLSAVTTRAVVPTARRSPESWRYTLRRPDAGDAWTRPGFDDAAWTPAPGGFGTRGTPNAAVRTEWRTADIWLRREFTLPDPVPEALDLLAFHDEDAEFALNGVPAAQAAGFTTDYVRLPIRPEARAALRPGRNVLAIHCRQERGGQFIDAGLIETRVEPAGP